MDLLLRELSASPWYRSLTTPTMVDPANSTAKTHADRTRAYPGRACGNAAQRRASARSTTAAMATSTTTMEATRIGDGPAAIGAADGGGVAAGAAARRHRGVVKKAAVAPHRSHERT